MISDYWGEYSNYSMSYSPSGMVGIKSCPDMLWDYWFGYSANNLGNIKSHQVRSIYDMDNDETVFLHWDADGQLQNILRPCSGDVRHHWCNEDGQMTAFVDNERCGFYGYNGNGERAYKLTGHSLLEQYNAGDINFQLSFDDAVLYVNPYFIVTPKGYTQHYYNGNQHIATKIGKLSDLPRDIIDSSSFASERIANARSYMMTLLGTTEIQNVDTASVFVDIDGTALPELQWQCLDEDWALSTQVQYTSNLLQPILTGNTTHLDTRVSGTYFYHPDHLGSATWITNSTNGLPVEFIHYMPFGEMWYNQQGSAYNERFRFTGKERDDETGYDFFGARYYASSLPLWLSVDPLADKYPYISPYAYCGWNPIKYVDPNGREWKDCDGNIIKDHSNIKAYIFYNKEEFGTQTTKMYSDLENKYGKGSVALSDVLTAKEFQQDWVAMSSQDIQEVSINHHGSNQAIHLDWRNNEYITSTGTGETRGGVPAINVSDLGFPSGNVSNATLNLNTCHSNSTGSWLGNLRIGDFRIPGTSATLVGTKETLMQSFRNNFKFHTIRGTSAGVSYNRKTLRPEPQFRFQSWVYLNSK